LVAQWRDRLGSSEAPLIGLHWQGNPSSEISGLQGRSFPLELFAPIAAALQIRLVALQKGPGHEQLQACSFRDRFVACQPQVDASWEFLDAAAILRHCDLLITNDTALAHLAGALGHPTWLLLHHVPDWRWGLQGDTTPWYPSLRLWRQHRRGDWPELLQRVLVGLQQRFPQAVR
jgi:ADP-heptose:LPS heptosyltransferase